MKEHLKAILEHKRKEIEFLHLGCDESFSSPRKSFKDSLQKKGFSIIAEFKRKSPSQGIIQAFPNFSATISCYEKAKVAAISILTDKTFFGGSRDDLLHASKLTELPLLRKDFIIDFRQVKEAKIYGASAILLIVSALKDRTKEFIQYARELQLDALVEVHDLKELEIALKAGCEIIGVNNRNLKTFEVDLKRAEMLISHIPPSILKIAESGIKGPDCAKRMHDAGYNAILIGESCMRAQDPVSFLRQCSLKELQNDAY